MDGQNLTGRRKFFQRGKSELNNKSLRRLNWKQMELQEGWNVVKGVTHRVIVVKSPDPRYFEEAIFVVRDDVLRERGADSAAILKEARKIANSYVGLRTKLPGIKTKPRGNIISRLPAPIFAAAGAAATGVAWLTARLCGL